MARSNICVRQLHCDASEKSTEVMKSDRSIASISHVNINEVVLLCMDVDLFDQFASLHCSRF